jgi:hypothetical protein
MGTLAALVMRLVGALHGSSSGSCGTPIDTRPTGGCQGAQPATPSRGSERTFGSGPGVYHAPVSGRHQTCTAGTCRSRTPVPSTSARVPVPRSPNSSDWAAFSIRKPRRHRTDRGPVASTCQSTRDFDDLQIVIHRWTHSRHLSTTDPQPGSTTRSMTSEIACGLALLARFSLC